MPKFNNVTTTAAEEIWRKGNRAIHKVTLNVNGKSFYAKTYSGQIAKAGWTGDIETYEKAGSQGPETFVRQQQKEQMQREGNKSQFNPFTMYLSYAKDLAIPFIGLEGKLNLAEYKKALNAVAEGGKMLFEASPDGAGQETKDLATMVDDVFGEGEDEEAMELPLDE